MYRPAATVVPWFIVATDKIFYLCMFTNSSYRPSMVFGDILSVVPADGYNTLLFAGTTSAGLSTQGSFYSAASLGTVNGAYMARSYSQTGTSVPAGLAYLGLSNITGASTSSVLPGSSSFISSVPHPATGYIYFNQVMVAENFQFRGIMPGLLVPSFYYTACLTEGDQISNIVGYSGKTFEVRVIGGTAGSSAGALLIEISDTW
jgi:hypothetical protein